MVSNATLRTTNNGVFSIFTGTTTEVERLTISPSGDVGIGTTDTTFQNGGGLVVYNSIPRIELRNPTSGATLTDGAGMVLGGNDLFVFNKENGPINLDTNGSTRMTITGAGNVGIGTTNPSSKLDVDGMLTLPSTGAVENLRFNLTSGQSTSRKWTIGNDFIDYGTFSINTETALNNNTYTSRFFINPSGNVGIGTTNPSAKLYVDGATGAGYVAQFNNSSTSGNLYGIASTFGTSGNNTNSWHFVGSTANVNAWFLYGNGTTSYSSDERLKKNIQTTRDGYLEDLMKLRVVKYNWKASEDGTPKELGLIAQEVEKVFPGLIHEHNVLEVGTRKNIKHSVMEFIVIKAIQELKQEVETLKEELELLKAKVD
jgi:hypothetical protein